MSFIVLIVEPAINMLTLYADLCHLTGKDRYKKHIGKFIEESRKNLAERKKTRQAMQEESQGIKKRARKQKEHLAEPVDLETATSGL